MKRIIDSDRTYKGTGYCRSLTDHDTLKMATRRVRVIKNPSCLRILRIIYNLKHGMSVTDIQIHMQVSQGIVSAYLSRLRICDFVLTRRNGKMIYYMANHETIERVINAIKQITY